MIIAHCFLRKMRKDEWYLMCETSATSGMVSPLLKPTTMFEVELDEDVETWEKQVRKHLLALRPDLEYVNTLKTNSPDRGRSSVFNLVFKPKQEKPKGFLQKLKGKL